MMNAMWAVVREGKIDFLEEVDLPEGATVLVTVLPDEDTRFWQAARQKRFQGVHSLYIDHGFRLTQS